LGFQLICELRIRCKTLQYTSAPLGIVCLRHQPIAGYPPLILGRLRVFMRLGRFADGHFAEDVDAARHTISYWAREMGTDPPMRVRVTPYGNGRAQMVRYNTEAVGDKSVLVLSAPILGISHSFVSAFPVCSPPANGP